MKKRWISCSLLLLCFALCCCSAHLQRLVDSLDTDDAVYRRALDRRKQPSFRFFRRKPLVKHTLLSDYDDSVIHMKQDIETLSGAAKSTLSRDLAGGHRVSDKVKAKAPAKVTLIKGKSASSSRILNNGERRKRLPQAIIIGVKKGGTRALLEFLRIHPDVRAPGPEPHFFDRHYSKGLEWYRNKMPWTLQGQLTIEKTPGYFITKGVPERVYNMSRGTRLIVVVRDPVTRAISDYTQTLSKKPNMPKFARKAFLANSTGVVDTSWGALRIGLYAKHLSRWLKHFPLSQIHFVSGEKLITDPAGEMAKVQDFLGLERVVNEKHFFFNTTKGFPCLKKHEGSKNPHCLNKAKGRSHPTIDERVLARLRDFFRPFNHRFYQLTGQDFGWP